MIVAFQVHQYRQDFMAAVHSYQAAISADPSLPAQHNINSIVKHLTDLEDLLGKKVLRINAQLKRTNIVIRAD